MFNSGDDEIGFLLVEEVPRLRREFWKVNDDDVRENTEEASNDSFDLVLSECFRTLSL